MQVKVQAVLYVNTQVNKLYLLPGYFFLKITRKQPHEKQHTHTHIKQYTKLKRSVEKFARNARAFPLPSLGYVSQNSNGVSIFVMFLRKPLKQGYRYSGPTLPYKQPGGLEGRASDQQKHLKKSKAYYLLCYHNICQPVDSVRLVLHIHPYKIQYDTVL
jgi:hypothetical protein